MVAAVLTILEFSGLPVQNGETVPVENLDSFVTRQDVTATVGGAAVLSAALNARTRFVSLFPDTVGYIAYGTAPTAAAATGIPVKTGTLIGKSYGVTAGNKISFIA